jgi:hypothetical protein
VNGGMLLSDLSNNERNTIMKQLVRKIIRYCRKKHVRICRHYSGRGMFGRTCIGFYGDSRECAEIAVTIKKKTGYNYYRDNLGLDMIYYFPDIADPSETASGE